MSTYGVKGLTPSPVITETTVGIQSFPASHLSWTWMVGAPSDSWTLHQDKCHTFREATVSGDIERERSWVTWEQLEVELLLLYMVGTRLAPLGARATSPGCPHLGVPTGGGVLGMFHQGHGLSVVFQRIPLELGHAHFSLHYVLALESFMQHSSIVDGWMFSILLYSTVQVGPL